MHFEKFMKQIFVLIALGIALLGPSGAQSLDSNYPDRRALIVNTSPLVELSEFGFQNVYKDRRTRFETSMAWKNIGPQPIAAFEIVILKYDAFNRRMVGERWTVTGNNSANWRPLQPGTSSRDGTIGFGEEQVFTAIAYVRAVRQSDGVVWEVSPAQVLTEMRKNVPGFKDFGKLEPDTKGRQEAP